MSRCSCREAMCGCNFGVDDAQVTVEKRKLSGLINRFSKKQKEKLHANMSKKSGWDDPNWTIDDIKKAMIAHIEKGDPVDAANFAAFWFSRTDEGFKS